MKQEFDTKTIEMFGMNVVAPSIEERVETATAAITSLFEQKIPVVIAYSGGKDSGTIAAIALNAAAAFKASGGDPLMIMTTGNTMVENPEVEEHYRSELNKAVAFAKQHGFRLVTRIVQPTLLSTFQAKVLTGRGIPTYAGAGSDCSTDLKVTPQKTFRNKLFRELKKKGYPTPVTLVGTRFDESDKRYLAMTLRGERADVPRENKDGEKVLCVIAHWSTEDVWEYIGMVTSGIWSAFTDFQETTRIYAHAAGTSCAVVADAIYEGGSKKQKGGCGTRTGCHVCQAADDSSLRNLVQFDPRYEYAAGLVKFNQYVKAIRYDWTRRGYVGRTIREGYICIEPDTFSATEVRALTRMMLQLDYDEAQRASHARERPKFELLPLEMQITVDAIQSLNGMARPFQIWADKRDIYERGIRYDIPDISPTPPQKLPDAKFLYVGREWDDSASTLEISGMRDVLYEAMTADSPCSPKLKTVRGGHAAWQVETEQSFSIDMEAAYQFEEFELDYVLQKFDQGYYPGGITAGFMHYMQLGGLIKLSHSQQSEYDEIARRTAFKDRMGLTLDYDVQDLLSRSTSFADLPEAARKAWAHKATDASSQTDFLSELDEAIEELLEAV